MIDKLYPFHLPSYLACAVQARVKFGPDSTGRVNQNIQTFCLCFWLLLFVLCDCTILKKCIQTSGIKGKTMNLMLLTSWIGLKTQWRKFVVYIHCYLSLETGVIISLMCLLTQARYTKMVIKKPPLPYFLLILTLYCIVVHISQMCKWDQFSLNLQVLGWVQEFLYEWLWLSFPSEVMQ